MKRIGKRYHESFIFSILRASELCARQTGISLNGATNVAFNTFRLSAPPCIPSCIICIIYISTYGPTGLTLLLWQWNAMKGVCACWSQREHSCVRREKRNAAEKKTSGGDICRVLMTLSIVWCYYCYLVRADAVINYYSRRICESSAGRTGLQAKGLQFADCIPQKRIVCEKALTTAVSKHGRQWETAVRPKCVNFETETS